MTVHINWQSWLNSNGWNWNGWQSNRTSHNIINGTSDNDQLTGTSRNNTINGNDGNDTIEGAAGNDRLSGGNGTDSFFFNPNRQREGRDIITDFTVGSDVVSLNLSDIVASTPHLFAAAGDPNALDLEDFEASGSWGASAGNNGNLVVRHPNGTIAFNGVPFSEGINTIGKLVNAGALAVNNDVATTSHAVALMSDALAGFDNTLVADLTTGQSQQETAELLAHA